MPLPRDTAGAYERGRKCYAEGRGLDQNPYIDEDGWPYPGFSSRHATAWEQGWLDAEEEQERNDDGTERQGTNGD